VIERFPSAGANRQFVTVAFERGRHSLGVAFVGIEHEDSHHLLIRR
jgi:hypothetical protein